MHQWTLQTRPRRRPGDWRRAREAAHRGHHRGGSLGPKRLARPARRASGGGLIERRHVHNVAVLPAAVAISRERAGEGRASRTPPSCWDDERAARQQFPRKPERAAALRAAVEIFRRARDRPERERFVTELSQHGACGMRRYANLHDELRRPARRTPFSRAPGGGSGTGTSPHLPPSCPLRSVCFERKSCRALRGRRPRPGGVGDSRASAPRARGCRASSPSSIRSRSGATRRSAEFGCAAYASLGENAQAER